MRPSYLDARVSFPPARAGENAEVMWTRILVATTGGASAARTRQLSSCRGHRLLPHTGHLAQSQRFHQERQEDRGEQTREAHGEAGEGASFARFLVESLVVSSAIFPSSPNRVPRFPTGSVMAA